MNDVLTETSTSRRLRDAADMSEKGLPFLEDDDLREEIEADIALWRKAADELEKVTAALVRIASPVPQD